MDSLPIVLVAVFIESFEQLKGKVFFSETESPELPEEKNASFHPRFCKNNELLQNL